MSTNAVKASVRKALTYGAQSARLIGARVDELKVTPTTVRALTKVVNITFDQARDELLPYLPSDERAAITVESWEEMTLIVADRIEHWLAGALVRACASGRLRKVRNGLFLNAAGNKSVSVDAAAGYIKQTAVPSLAWVLEQDWILNNMGDVITCVVSLTPGLSVPILSAVRTPLGEFRFRALPWHVHEVAALEAADWRDTRFAHPRATPEKALCDWLYLAASPRSPMRPPPLDLEAERLDAKRLRRLAKAMSIQAHLDAWLQSKRRYDGDPDVIENASVQARVRKR